MKMGNGYNNHHSIHQHHHHFHQKTLFFPMLCRLSIKDINNVLNKDHRIPTATENDPSSPKVSCMGQVKRNNRVIGFPTTTTAASASTAVTTYHHKYSKLKKLFSSKTLLPPAPTMPIAAAAGGGSAVSGGGRSGSRSCKTRKEMCVNNLRTLRLKNEFDGDKDCRVKVVVNIGEMDPPLPVVKKVAPPANEINIWKRRFNGTGLKSLQIEQINLPNCEIQPPTTV